MKKQILCAAISCVLLLAGCGNETPLDSSVSESSVETSSSSSSSVESSSEPNSTSGGQNSSSSEVADNQDIIKSSSTATPDPDTSSSEPTSDTHEPSTSEPTSDTSEPTSSSSNSGTTSSSKPTGETSKPTSSSSSSTTSKPSSQPVTSTWNPNAPGNTPGPYKDSYIDVAGNLHCKYENMPKDSYGYPVESYYTETGMHVLTKTEKDAYDENTKRIDQGGGRGAYEAGLTDDEVANLRQ